MPYFSIILPTRNRPALVIEAVNSVLEQDFSDFELIVSDNSDATQAEDTRARLKQTLTDNRVRYVRPERILPMTDHWEWAVRHAQGTFAGVLTDRSVYRLYALATFHRNIEKHGVDLVTCLTDTIFGEEPPFRIKLRGKMPPPRMVMSRDMLLDFSQSRFSKRGPRMLNGFCRTKRLREMADRYGSVFTGLCPDYSFGFHAMDWIEKFISLDDRLILLGANSQTNGEGFRANRMNTHSRDFLALMQSQTEWLDYGLLEQNQLLTPGNAILREYEITRRHQASGRLPPIDKQKFYAGGVAEAIRLASLGFDQRQEFAALEEFRRMNSLSPAGSVTLRSHRSWRSKITQWRETLRDRVFSVMTQSSKAVHDGRPLFRLGKWCAFSSVMAALRYDAQRHCKSVRSNGSSAVTARR